MGIEKKELLKLRKSLRTAINQAWRMQDDETAFVINDRLHGKLDGRSLASWMEKEFETIFLEIDSRVTELM